MTSAQFLPNVELAVREVAHYGWLLQQSLMPEPTPVNHPRQKLVAILLAFSMMAVVVELVRKQKLREEYALLWLVTGLVLLALAIYSDLLTWFQQLVGAAYPTSALFFGGFVFLMLVALQVSVRLSKLTFRNNSLTQRVALLEREIEDLQRRIGRPPAGHTGASKEAARLRDRSDDLDGGGEPRAGGGAA